MGLFINSINERIKRDSIIIKDENHYEELYFKYRDELFLERYGKTFLEWKTNKNKSE